MPSGTHHRAVALVLTAIAAAGLARRGPPPVEHAPPLRAAPISRRVEPPQRIDPNHADIATLETLPGVGPRVARRIVEARGAGVVFRVPDDLMQVRGIGPRAVARLGPLLRFERSDAAASAAMSDAAP